MTTANDCGTTKGNRMTKNEIKEQAFMDTQIRTAVRYTHTDEDGDNWEIECPMCMGNGYDIGEIDLVRVCPTCEGMGSSAPVHEADVKAFFAGSIDLPV